MQFIDIYPVMNTPEIFKQPMSLALAHLVEQYPAYAKVFRCYGGYKILDNSVVELGGTVSIERLLNAACAIEADEIILPDILRNKEGTLQLVKQSIKYLQKSKQVDKFHIMAVIQGESRKELEECFNAYLNIPEIRVIGIPKWTNEFKGGRVSFEYLWLDQICDKEIHLLGCRDTLTELLQYKNPSRIRSCDSSLRCLHKIKGEQPFANRAEGDVIDLESSWIQRCAFDKREINGVFGI